MFHCPPKLPTLTLNAPGPQRSDSDEKKRVLHAQGENSKDDLGGVDEADANQPQTKRRCSVFGLKLSSRIRRAICNLHTYPENCETPRAKGILPPLSLSSGSDRSIPYMDFGDSDDEDFRPGTPKEIERDIKIGQYYLDRCFVSATYSEVILTGIFHFRFPPQETHSLRRLPSRSSRPPLGSMKLKAPPRERR